MSLSMASLVCQSIKDQNLPLAKYLKPSDFKEKYAFELPKIYTRIFGLKFTITISADGSTGSAGIQFVIKALQAIQVQPKDGAIFAPNTIKSHYQAARKSAKD